jgi:hypothetical protein
MKVLKFQLWKILSSRLSTNAAKILLRVICPLLQANSGRFLWDICCCRQIAVEFLLLLFLVVTVNDADYVASNESLLNKYFVRIVKKRSTPKCRMWI